MTCLSFGPEFTQLNVSVVTGSGRFRKRSHNLVSFAQFPLDLHSMSSKSLRHLFIGEMNEIPTVFWTVHNDLIR
jgi:hypothetical protein